MKQKLLSLLLLFITVFTVQANTNSNYQYYRAYQYTQRYVIDNGYRTSWSAWTNVNINITFDLSNDIIWVFSQKAQKYSIYKSDIYYDSDGEKY